MDTNYKLIRAVNDARGDLSFKEWCKGKGFTIYELKKHIHGMVSPINKDGQLSALANKILDALYCIPEDIWDNEVLYPFENNFSNFNGIYDILSQADEDYIYKDCSEYVEDEQFADRVEMVLNNLSTEKNVSILRKLYYEDLTLKQTGNCYNLSQERIRQIEAKMLRMLRHPTRCDFLRDLHDDFLSSPPEKEVSEYRLQFEKELKDFLFKYKNQPKVKEIVDKNKAPEFISTPMGRSLAKRLGINEERLRMFNV